MATPSTLTAELEAALASQSALPDPATGLVHLGDGRFYDPALGRPLQPDPAGGPPTVPQALNRYAVPVGGTGQWSWAGVTLNGAPATLPITTTGLYTVSLWMREDGLRLDRLLLTTDTTYVPTGYGPIEERITTGTSYFSGRDSVTGSRKR